LGSCHTAPSPQNIRGPRPPKGNPAALKNSAGSDHRMTWPRTNQGTSNRFGEPGRSRGGLFDQPTLRTMTLGRGSDSHDPGTPAADHVLTTFVVDPWRIEAVLKGQARAARTARGR